MNKDLFNEMALYLESVYERKLKASELERLTVWLDKGINYADITKAYGIMCKKCERPVFNYMAAILDNKF